MRSEKVAEVVDLLSKKYACAEQEQNLRVCVERHGVKTAREMGKRNLCQQEVTAMARCTQGLQRDPQKINQLLAEKGLEGCPRSISELEDCIERHQGDMSKCKDQANQIMECAADYVLAKHADDAPLFSE